MLLYNSKRWLHRLNNYGGKFRSYDEEKFISFNRILTTSNPDTIKRKVIASKTYAKSHRWAGKQIRAFGIATQFPEEVSAWLRGMSHLKTFRQKAAMAKASIRPLASYALMPTQQIARNLLIAGGVGSVAYGLAGLFKRSRTRKGAN